MSTAPEPAPVAGAETTLHAFVRGRDVGSRIVAILPWFQWLEIT